MEHALLCLALLLLVDQCSAALLGRRGPRLNAGASMGSTTVPPTIPPLQGVPDPDLDVPEELGVPEEHHLDPADVEKAILEGDASIVDGVKKRFRECIDDFRRLPSGMRNMFDSNMHIIERLMPGMEARTSSIITLPVVVTTGALWGMVYFVFFYSPDHEDHHLDDDNNSRGKRSATPRGPTERRPSGLSAASSDGPRRTESCSWEDAWAAQQLEASEGSTNKIHLNADVIFVFPHPGYELQPDRGKVVTRDLLRRAMAHRSDADFFTELEGIIMAHEVKMSRASATDKALRRLKSGVGEALDITMAELRILILKDMCRSLPLLGFSVNLFSSIDDEELFLCVSLSRPEVVQHYLQRENVELQTTHAVVERLGILQDQRDPCSSPPFLRFDHRLVKSLHKANVIDEAEEWALYRTYHDRGTQGSVMKSAQRIHVIQRELSRFLNLEAAKEVGIVKEWYPCHSELWLNKLQETWASLESVTDLSFVQPIPLVGEYYGSMLAFSFAWQGVWSKGLVCLSLAAILITVLKFVPIDLAVKLVPVDIAIRSGYHTLVPERQLMPFAILIAAWARVMTNLWRRDEEYFQTLWNQHNVCENDNIIRPSFKGVLMKSDVDGSIMEENAPLNRAIGLRVLSVCITLVCCVATMLISGTWVHIHRGDLDLVASVWLSVIVKVSELLYNMLSARLVEMENHKYDQDYHDSWVWQQFLFQAVNNYWPCVSVGFSQVVTGHCPEIGCFLALQRQCSMLVGILLACSIGLSILEGAQVWLALKLEDRKLQKHNNEGGEVRHRSFLEEQSKYAPFNMRAQIENMLQLVIGLGFVLLFGTLQPMVAPLCLIHFACALRLRAMLLTWKFTMRPFPHKLGGVGAWSGVMGVLMNFGVFSSGVLVVLWGRFFHGALLLAKISALVMWFVLIAGVGALVDITVPPKSPQAQVMSKRRNHAVRVLTEASLDSQHMVHQSPRPPRTPRSSTPREAAPRSSTPREAAPPVDAVDATVIDEAVHESSHSSSFGSSSSSSEESETHRHEKRRLTKAATTLQFTDSTTRRTVGLELGCDVKDLIPQGQIVKMEDWQAIPRLDGETAAERTSRRLSFLHETAQRTRTPSADA